MHVQSVQKYCYFNVKCANLRPSCRHRHRGCLSPQIWISTVGPYLIIAGICAEFEAGRTLERTDIRGN